ncbi:MAG: NAD(+) diphosphatase [Gammaproteobacteria bacterium]|nr:NAD(+) diphosphatase [Gammaproteobacteria bacterium]
MKPANAFANAPLERRGELRKSRNDLSALLTKPDTRFLLVAAERNVIDAASGKPILVDPEELAALSDGLTHSIMLGEYQGSALFVADLDNASDELLASTLGARTENLRTLGLRLSPEQASLAAYARAMVLWDRRHRYCGRCGGATASDEAGHVRRCINADCGNAMFPRVDPAIIVLVSDGERALLGRQASWDPNRYSTLAGFVEPGESLEEAVAREVREESAIEVEMVDYHSSQPWPFPSSLMLGFVARARTTSIQLLDGELEHADWFSRNDIASRRIHLPFPVSISYRLIEDWYDGGEPGRMRADLDHSDAQTLKHDRDQTG